MTQRIPSLSDDPLADLSEMLGIRASIIQALATCVTLLHEDGVDCSILLTLADGTAIWLDPPPD